MSLKVMVIYLAIYGCIYQFVGLLEQKLPRRVVYASGMGHLLETMHVRYPPLRHPQAVIHVDKQTSIMFSRND